MNYIWNLSDMKKISNNGHSVFSCFSCGGGSSMGYKLSGYDVIGNVEIDSKMMNIYRVNHSPKHSYLMDIKVFNKIPDEELPQSLFELDILDGSPPCSTFSLAGKREDKWGVEKRFREGQQIQRLDTLFFDFIDTAEKLNPKIVISENVTGILKGNAKGFVSEIVERFSKINYTTQIFTLNAATMGVPQYRERVFFISRRNDLNLSPIDLNFNYPIIPFREIKDVTPSNPLDKGKRHYSLWSQRIRGDLGLGDVFKRLYNRNSFFGTRFMFDFRVVNTITSSERGKPIRYDSPCYISDTEIIKSQTFPQDFNFCGQSVQYVCGMSVPPIMMSRISSEIQKQWLD